jgi:hypothetical protein
MDGIKLSELVKNRGEIDLMITEIGDFVKENNELVADLEKKGTGVYQPQRRPQAPHRPAEAGSARERNPDCGADEAGGRP